MRFPTRCLVVTLAPLTLAISAFAQFTPGPDPITGTVGAQTLSTGTGTVNSGGTIGATNSVALTMNGTSTLVNNGTIQTTGTGRAIDSGTANSNLTLTNTGLISAVSTDAFRVNANSAVSLINSGTIQVTAGGQAIDWAAITNKSNSLTNQVTGIITAVGDDAVRPGTNGVVINNGTIRATPTIDGTGAVSGSDGVDVRTLSGISVLNTGSITGRSGIATDGSNAGPSTITVNNNAGIIMGVNGSGINIDGVSVNVTANVINLGGATIQGGVLAAGAAGDGDGIDVDGVLTLNNTGKVLGLGAKGLGSDGLANNPEAIAAGGGSITNNVGGQIIGSSLAADAPTGDPTRAGSGILIDNSSGGNAVAATTVTNSGLIQGKTGFGIKIIDTFADTIINNMGGIIRGAGTGAAILTGDGGDAITNRGSIVSDIGNAIDLEAGDDFLKIEGGAASIVGNVSGGAGSNTFTLDPGTGNTFFYSDAISNFDLVEAYSGMMTLSGVSTYTGTTRVTGGTLKLDGANRLSSGSTLDLNGGTLETADAGGANGQTFACLTLSDSSTIDLDSTSLTFNCLGAIGAGKTLTIRDYLDTVSPNYAFRFLGNLSTDANFLALIGETTINGVNAAFRFDGSYTDVVATPEPSTFALIGLGGALLLGCARYRKPCRDQPR